MLESAARPHRSKKVRPCDRCRKRKARCDVLKAGDACISCSVSKSACTFADPVLKKPLRPSAVVFDASASSSTLPGPSNPALIAQIIESVTTADQISPSSGLHGLLKDALSAVDSVPAQSGEDLFTETDAVRLDLELDEEVELHYISPVMEADALALLRNRKSDKDSKDHFTVRQVSQVVSKPAYFVYHRTRPYPEDTPEGDVLGNILKIVGEANADTLFQHYCANDNQAVPILDPEINDYRAVNKLLAAICIAQGLIYMPDQSHLLRRCWTEVLIPYIRKLPLRASLSAIQCSLANLHSRDGINLAGNAALLGQTVSTSHLLGLHADSTHWNISPSEKTLRVRLYWAMFIYDKAQALCYGWPSNVRFDAEIPLPTGHDASSAVFNALVRLHIVIDKLLLVNATSASATYQYLEIAKELDVLEVDITRLRADLSAMGSSPAGFKSLQLLHQTMALILPQRMHSLTPNSQILDVVLQKSQSLVDFFTSLKQQDLDGYWSAQSPLFLSFLVATMLKVIKDEAQNTFSPIFQTAHTLFSTLYTFLEGAEAQKWTCSQLALDRARFLSSVLGDEIPLLKSFGQQSTHLASPAENVNFDDFINAFLAPHPTWSDIDVAWPRLVD